MNAWPLFGQECNAFSDMHKYRVMNVDLDGNTKTITEVPEWSSGLGWLPDGCLLVVSMTDKWLLKPNFSRRVK